MSQETSQWLNTMTLIGFTDKRGKAWHYRASDQGAEPNHYPEAIPTADIKRRLFNWTPAEGTVETTLPGGRHIVDASRKAIVHPDTGEILGVFRQGFQVHDYNEWLIQNTQTLLDAEGLGASSAGLLKGGAVAWVQAEMPESVTTPEGVEGRPFITAATSLDGSLSSTYLTGTQLVVCDNTLSAALGEKGTGRVKVKHSRNSLGKLGEVRDALGIVYQTAEDFMAEVAELCAVEVTDKQWDEFLAAHLGDKPDPAKSVRSANSYDRHREGLVNLYRHDNRVAPWAGTAFGVVQAVNTYEQHVKNVKGAGRAERNMDKMVRGEFDKLDTTTLDQLNMVLAA